MNDIVIFSIEPEGHIRHDRKKESLQQNAKFTMKIEKWEFYIGAVGCRVK